MEQLKEALVQSSIEVLTRFGVNPVFQSETVDTALESASQVNVLIGLTAGMRGNVVLGLSNEAALKIARVMMAGMEVNNLDLNAKSALAEVTNMIVGAALCKLNSATAIDYSPPTLVTGAKIFLVISRLQSYKLTFCWDENLYDISYCLE
jgi:chemotaxis protein CheX